MNLTYFLMDETVTFNYQRWKVSYREKALHYGQIKNRNCYITEKSRKVRPTILKIKLALVLVYDYYKQTDCHFVVFITQQSNIRPSETSSEVAIKFYMLFPREKWLNGMNIVYRIITYLFFSFFYRLWCKS